MAYEDPSALLPLPVAQLHILLALADGEKHGYAIMSEVEVMTDGDVTMGPGTLYGTVKRMLNAGLVEETNERPDPELDDERRRYYRLSGFGARVLDAEVAGWCRSPVPPRRSGLLETGGSGWTDWSWTSWAGRTRREQSCPSVEPARPAEAEGHRSHR
jgi:DNA-binding PadR family transcriptional regulator